MSDQHATDRYWKTNIRVVLGLLSIWFIVSYLFGIILVEWLNQWHVGGFPVGFWFAQQGSIVVFIGLILAYCLIMDRLDARLIEGSEDK
jgi:putative solute:sodium symporter small subunit